MLKNKNVVMITKRDGAKEEFDINKIYEAIKKAYIATYKLDILSFDKYREFNNILTYLSTHYHDSLTDVEKIQDAVEKSLMECGYHDVAKTYILYRKKRENIRNAKSDLNKLFNQILSDDSSDDLLRENANINTNTPMGLMLLFGSEYEKTYVKRNLINERFVILHDEGYMHIHDLNFYACTFNCCHIDLETLFKDGFNTGDGYIRRPKSIQSAASLASIIIQSNQNDMFGGQGIPMFEYNFAPYVAKSFGKRLKECIELALGVNITDTSIESYVDYVYNEYGSALDNLDKIKSYISELVKEKTDFVLEKAIALTDKDTYQAMEGFIHNMNSLHSRCLPEDEEVITLNIKHARDIDKMSDTEKNALRDLIIELYKDRTIPEVAKELCISHKSMNNIFCKLGIHKRNKYEVSEFVSKRYNEMYGVTNPMQLESVKNKARNTQFEKYGCFGFNTDKQKETNIERYGCENCMCNESVKEKLKQTNLKKYGYTCTLQVPVVKEKTKRTNIERYGCENVFCKNSPIRNKISYEKSEEHKRKIKETRIKKYGGEFGDSPIIKEKIISTCMKRYGLEYYPLMNHAEHTSIKQKEIFDYISNKFADLDIQLNVISLIKEHKTLQIDIWIPQIRLGIEYNGIYWHDKNLYLNDLKENTIKSKERLKDYYATTNNFTLIHVWEDDYLSDSTKILNMITDIIENLLKE